MGGLTGAVYWWEESQLRVLVLSSLVIQLLLLSFPILRRLAIPGWFRFIMWLTYHGGDAVAIYALATLFNRHKDEGNGGTSTLLEVVWAPVLLIHLGGCDGVTAYNIEDKELWSRHLLTSVSQITVAVYVFCKSWPSDGDKRLLRTAILLFIVGVGKCFFKALAFKRASIYSIVSFGSADALAKETNDGIMYNKLDEYVKRARDIVVAPKGHQVMEEEDPGPVTVTKVVTWCVELIMKPIIAWALIVYGRRFVSRALSSRKDGAAEGSSNHPRSQLRGEKEEASLSEERGEASKLFVDLSSPYPRRIKIFEKFWGLREDRAYDSVRGQLASAFLLLYTKLKTAVPDEGSSFNKKYMEHLLKGNKYVWYDLLGKVGVIIVRCMVFSRLYLPSACIYLFYQSHKKPYYGIDVKVTYVILCCTAALEACSFMAIGWGAVDMMDGPSQNNKSPRVPSLLAAVVWPETVAQYSLAGYFVRNKKHSIKMGIVSLLGFKDFLDQLWCMEPSFSSARITHLVLRYLENGWKQEIQDTASYRSFNNHSNHWGLNMNRPFDECVVLWHLATEFCFFSTSFPDHRCAFAEDPELRAEIMVPAGKCSQDSADCKAVQCRQMSNYMVYLLFVNPEMLLPGSRRNLFKTAYDELKGILKDWKWKPVCWSRCMPCGVKQIKEEAVVMKELNERMNETGKRPSQEGSLKEATVAEIAIPVTQEKSETSSQEGSSKEAIITEIAIPDTQEKPEISSPEGSSMEGSDRDKKFIRQAWDLAQELLKKDEMEMWKEIQDVWVQMLCFSASRCRGYLHAKALGKGGEFLSYVWLLLFYMGMETFSERLQRELLSKELSQGHQSTTNFGGLHKRRHSTSF